MSLKLFLIWTFVLIARPQDFFPFLVALRPALIVTILMMAISFFNNKINITHNILTSNQVKKYFLLYFIIIIGVPFSLNRGRSVEFIIFEYLSNILYFYLFFVYINSREKLKNVLFVICLSTLFYAGLSLLYSGPFTGRFSYGTMYDPNDFAYLLVSLFPLSLYFLRGKESGYKKIIAAITIVLSLAVIVMTGSRGGLLGLLIVLLLLFFTRFGLLKRPHKVLLFIILIAALSAYSEKIDIRRYKSLFDIQRDYNVTSEAGRLTVWKRGIELALMNPFTGVGANCFPVAIGYYREKLRVLPRWQTAHNSYLLILTELGFFGFIIFISMILSAIRIFLVCARQGSSSTNHQPIMAMSNVIFLAFSGSLVCAFFLSQAYSIILTLFFAFSAVLQDLSGESEKLLSQ